MTNLAQTALAFARECLGWDHPVDRKYAEQNKDPFGKPSKVWTPYIFDFYGKHDQFHYTDLNAVMAAVRSWRDTMQEALDEYVTVTLGPQRAVHRPCFYRERAAYHGILCRPLPRPPGRLRRSRPQAQGDGMIDQIGIAMLGCTAIWLSQDEREERRRLACLFGMAAQPFWYYAA